MSSILTNNSAMVALQTLRGINKNLEKTQQDISTGKSIGTARDNAAVWAISKVMESDVGGFEAISDSLNLGSSSIAVARSAAEQVTELLGEIKKNIVSAQEQNVDRVKINDDIGALRDQIASITGSAQFNGLNMLSNTSRVAGTGSVNILSSLNRNGTSGIKAATITVGKQDFGTSTQVLGAATTGGTMTGTSAAANTTTVITIQGGGAGGAIVAGESYSLNGLGSTVAAVYVARDGDTAMEVATGIIDRLNFEMAKRNEPMTAGLTLAAAPTGIAITNTTATAAAITTAVGSGGTPGGGFAILGELNVTTDAGARSALVAVEGLIQVAIKAAAEFGTAQKRIDIQNTFVNALKDSLRSGISTLVDADMEESSARLQALQVQQQLGVQALSIANQAPQSILSLFGQ